MQGCLKATLSAIAEQKELLVHVKSKSFEAWINSLSGSVDAGCAVYHSEDGQLFDVLIADVRRFDTQVRRVNGFRVVYMLESERLLHQQSQRLMAVARQSLALLLEKQTGQDACGAT